MNMQSVYIKTYGCQMNVYDSERMAELLFANGYKEADDPSNADIVILNTCNIREKAAEKIYSELGRIRKHKLARKEEGRDMIVAVAGCVAQAEGKIIMKRAPIVDIVIGPESYHHLPDMLSDIKRKTKKGLSLNFTPNEKFDSLPKNRIAKGFSSFITVQEGCDKFCTFCVVPYTRGKEYSRPVDEIIDEVKNLVEQGVVEISLLGQNVDAYHGKWIDRESTLAQLIDEVSKIPQIKRIRYTTSHPNNFTEDLIDAHKINPKLMPYLHLPVQSGSNSILQAMNRKHTREKYFKIIENLRKARPDIALSSDFIVAFPGETDDDFAQTIDLVEKVGFSQSYSFKYSPRPGTPASMKEPIPEDIANQRLYKLQNLLKSQQNSFNAKFLGASMPILFENKGIRGGNQVVGKSPYLQAVIVNIPEAHKPEEYFGKIMPVEITSVKENSLFGEII
ncbi:MAG: tRNA-2-methylthio-N6-dimethylallyladenosine synthase [Candidatus Deianiraeaceae bacterium]|jgi:tRNA-2-methylthio-N6-dimethylallyladenosine synthase